MLNPLPNPSISSPFRSLPKARTLQPLVNINGPQTEPVSDFSPVIKYMPNNPFQSPNKPAGLKIRHLKNASHSGLTSINMSGSKVISANVSTEKNPFQKLGDLYGLSTQNFKVSFRINKSGTVPSEEDGRSPRDRSLKSDSKLISLATHLSQAKRAELWPHLQPLSCKPTSVDISGTFTETAKKYKLKSIKRVGVSKSVALSQLSQIEEIKQYFKMPILKNLKTSSAKPHNELKEMEEINIVKKPGQSLSEEEEMKVKILKKKVEISNVFKSQYISDEEKKEHYKQLMLEFHPDKTKHHGKFAVEIFYFLQSNKNRLLNIE